MKPLFLTAILGTGILMAGCVDTVVERHHDHDDRSGYYNGGDPRYRNDGYRGSENDTQYRTRNVDRTNVTETNVNETNVNRTDVNRTDVNRTNRTAVKTQPQRGQATTAQQPSRGGNNSTSTSHTQVTKKKVVKKTADDQKKPDGNDPQH